MGEIVTVNFRGDDLYGFKEDDGTWLAVRPMCEAMGLSWSGQFERIKRDATLSKAIRVTRTPFAGNGGQEVVCLPLDKVHGWLFTIDDSRIKDDEVRARVLVYKDECYDVLYAHFTGKRRSLVGDNDEEPDGNPSMNERRSLVAEARQTFGAMAARQLWFNQNLPIVPAMVDQGQNDIDLFHYGMVAKEAAA